MKWPLQNIRLPHSFADLVQHPNMRPKLEIMVSPP